MTLTPGIIDFQLYLLKAMDPPQAVAAAALAELDRSPEQMIASFEKVHRSTWILEGGSAENILPLVEGVGVPVPPCFSAVYEMAFALPLWPELLLAVAFNSDSRVFDAVEFVRAPDSTQVPEVRPWRLLEKEAYEVFDRVEEVESWGDYRILAARNGEHGEVHRLRFGRGLFCKT
ncbi:hypothetical protein [Nocardia thailandica]|uniref:hypothetical protein n=1 Tax=Nocardia thailandica TaxID=257275 RepID=UPI0012F9B6DA|nr:hypothetical protein [Nocardia thailandica]